MKISEIIKQPEGRKIEFKEAMPKKSELNKTIVAFANDAGGQLFIGIKDDPREIVGVDEDHLMSIEEEISNSIHDNCSPVILPDIMFFNHQGRHIIVVNIYKGSNPPYYIKSKGRMNGTYIRVGSTNRLADNDIIEELERQKRNISFDSLTVYAKEFADLELSAFKNHFEDITGEKATETVLKKLNLIVRDQNRKFPTNALILLSGDTLKGELFPYAKIECARFKGTTPGNFIDQKTIDIPLSLQAEEAYKFILRHISQGSTYEGVYRKDRWEYPVIAIREIIRNAVIHRDYSLRGKDIKVAVFDDKIEITSPGKLMPTVDFNDLEAGQSDIKNKTLAPVFKKLGIIEQWGNGLQLIAEELKKYPEIEMRWSEPGIGFRVTFLKTDHGQTPSDTVGKPSEKTKYATDHDRLRPITTDYDRLTNEQKKILLYLLDHEQISRREAVKILSLGETKTKEILNSLFDINLIERKGKGRSTYYCLISNIQNDK